MNPFSSTIVADPWNSLDADVQEIHAAAFNRCCAALGEVRNSYHTTSVLIHGEAGSGKTHLLARLRSHLSEPAVNDGATHRGAIFIAVRLQTGPRMIWRHVQNQFAIDLLRPSNSSVTQLEKVFLHRLNECGLAKGEMYRWLSGGRTSSRNLDDLSRELEALLDHIGLTHKFPDDLFRALKHLLLGTHRREAGAWLRGEMLPESTLATMGIVSGDDENDDREDRAHKIVTSLCDLAGAKMPVVFCFDQIEALQSAPRDKAGLFAFGQMASSLHANTRNVLIISCIQFSFLNELKESVSGADYARLREFSEITLNPLTWDEASRLITARLNSSPDLSAERAVHNDSLWPLPEADVRSTLGPTGCTARKLIARCAELFDSWRMGEASLPHKQPVEDFLYQYLQERLEYALTENAPEQTEKIIEHGLPMLLHLTGRQCEKDSLSIGRDIDFVIGDSDEQITLSLCKETPQGLWRRLVRLKDKYGNGRIKDLVLLRDARLPISSNATVTLQRREELISRGARWVTLTAEMMAALDALRKLISAANSGDLAQYGDTISSSTVEQWLSRNLRTGLPQLTTLLEGITGKAPDDTPYLDLCERLLQLLEAHHLISVEDAAGLLQGEPVTVFECARRYQDRFGLLQGPPTILFQLTNEMINV